MPYRYAADFETPDAVEVGSANYPHSDRVSISLACTPFAVLGLDDESAQDFRVNR
jgi:hypothetical protein